MNMPPNRIRYIRRLKEMSGTEIAEKLGISAQYYYNLERGNRNLSAELASGLAKIFDVSVDYLLGLSDDTEPAQTTKTTTISESSAYYDINKKDERDIAKELERLVADLESDTPLAFHGSPLEGLDEEEIELLRNSLENSLRVAKQLAKKKFTPKKYR